MKKKTLFVCLAVLTCMVVVYVVCTHKQRELRFSRTNVAINDSPFDIGYGSDTAKLSVYMFVDYNCGYCRQFLLLNLPYIQQKYIDNGLVRFVIKPIVLSENKDMMMAIQLAECMYQNGDFDDINELLLSEPSAVYSEEFNDLIKDILNENHVLAECLLSSNFENIKQNNIAFNGTYSNGTPIFVIGKHLYEGYRNLNDFCKVLDYELN